MGEVRARRVSRVWGKYFLGSVLVVAAAGSAFATSTDYSIPEEDIAALLDDEFYSGDPGQYGAATGTLRWAYLAAINNAGTQVAFTGLTFDSFPIDIHERMFVVDVGQPSSWREINTIEDPPLVTPVWSPDDQYIAIGTHRINMTTGAEEKNYYTFTDPLGLNLANAGTGPIDAWEFNTNGDLEGWGFVPDGNNITDLSVSGGTIHGTISGSDPYFSLGGLSISTAGNTYLVFRMKITSDVPRDSGRPFWRHVGFGYNSITFISGPPGEWRTYVMDLAGDPDWAGPDVDALRFDPCDFCSSGTFEIDFARLYSGTNLPEYTGVGISDQGAVDRSIFVSSVTAKGSGDFAAGFNQPGTYDAYIFPISNNLSPLSTELSLLTNFPGSSVDVRDTNLSGDGTLMTVSSHINSSQPDINLPGHLSFQQDVYVLDGILEIMAGVTSPPTSFADPRFHEIRTEAEGGSRWKGVPLISPDKSIVVYTEDFAINMSSSTTSRWSGSAESFAAADFDVMLSTPLGNDGPPVDSFNTSDDRRFPNAGNQYISGATKNGLRLIWQEQDSIFDPLKIYITTFVQTTNIDAETDPVPAGPTDVGGGQIVVLTDSAVETTVPVTVQDASGTSITVPVGQIINFPEGSGATGITISTPTSPVEQAQLPPGSGITDIPVQRTFGPVGTYFYPPVAITITYLSSEIGGADEDTIVPYLYNTLTGIFDIRVPESDIILRDPANNSITFLVDHFSTYALAISNPQQALSGLPSSSGAGLALLSALMVAAYAARRRKH